MWHIPYRAGTPAQGGGFATCSVTVGGEFTRRVAAGSPLPTRGLAPRRCRHGPARRRRGPRLERGHLPLDGREPPRSQRGLARPRGLRWAVPWLGQSITVLHAPSERGDSTRGVSAMPLPRLPLCSQRLHRSKGPGTTWLAGADYMPTGR